jgi:hypothetical protein
VIVFGGHEDVAVELRDLLLPALGNRVLRGRPGIRRHLIEEGHRKVAQVNNFRVDIAALGRNILDPLRRHVAEACGARGADDDRDLEFAHGSLYLWLQMNTEAR